MECSYSKGILEIISKVNGIRENVIMQLMKDNGVSGADLEFGKFRVEKTGSNKTSEILRLLDGKGKYIDGYRVLYNYSSEGVRVSVVKV
ncbi:MAG: hypothetical protein ACRCX8_06675 [Sarcina sp.]